MAYSTSRSDLASVRRTSSVKPLLALPVLRWVLWLALLAPIAYVSPAFGQNGARSDSVWVNTSSRVYHCPGTRYFGNTARGRFLTEDAALSAGYRAAYGKGCGQQSGAALRLSSPPSEPSGTKVWVNSSSRVYHCPGSRYFGTTKRGRFVSEAEARAAGNRPAGGKPCRP